MERIVIINESTFTKWMERVKELLSVLHCQEHHRADDVVKMMEVMMKN